MSFGFAAHAEVAVSNRFCMAFDEEVDSVKGGYCLDSPRSDSTTDCPSPSLSDCESPTSCILDLDDDTESVMEVKNTFVHFVNRARGSQRRALSAPGGLAQEMPVMRRRADTQSPRMVWADEVDDLEIDDELPVAIKDAEAAILEHLRLESSGSMSLSTIGNRIPKKYITLFKARGVRVSDVVAALKGVVVNNGIAYVEGAEVKAEVVSVYCRGEYVKKIKRGEVTESEISEITAVLSSVFELVQASEMRQLSTFALGNWLAPTCRSFLKAHSLRLLELLKEFPMIFNCKAAGTESKPVVRIVAGASVEAEAVQEKLLARACR
mmetsp:Transcript_53818/g.122414  ORF Transcript_53818/g.122414 Transcript_53818/m.122414 type:complete len:323 (+) Transcript_53818:69-1037(+)